VFLLLLLRITGVALKGTGGNELTRMEGIIPAIESAHAVAALKKMKFKKDDVVVLTVSGRGDKDVETYLSHKEMAGEYGNF
jgi:tryptophan synthase beta chain